MTKLKISNGDKTEHSYCDKTQEVKLSERKKLKISNWDKTQKLKMWKN